MNRGFTYTNEIDADAAGETVVAFYARRYPHSTEPEWRERIEHGAVRLDGAAGPAAGWAVGATLAATVLSGFAPILGKFAYRAGVTPFTLAALRTALAAGLLWVFYLVVWRRYIRIPWRLLPGCIGMGVSNGLGSLLYYSGLSRMDASLAHMLYAMYPFWVFIFLSAAGHLVSRLAVVRLALVMLMFIDSLWAALGGWAMGLWMALAGIGMYLVMSEKRTSTLPD